MPANTMAPSASCPAFWRCRRLQRADLDLPFGIDVLAFGDEEGSRFRSTLSSSLACAGNFDTSRFWHWPTPRWHRRSPTRLSPTARRVEDIPAAAYDPAQCCRLIWKSTSSRGQFSKPENLPLGVVTGIIGQSRMRVTVESTARRAMPVPCRCVLRRDALAGAAEMVLAAGTVGVATPKPTAWSRRSVGSKRFRTGQQCHPRLREFLAGVCVRPPTKSAEGAIERKSGQPRNRRRHGASSDVAFEPLYGMNDDGLIRAAMQDRLAGVIAVISGSSHP